MRVAQIFLRVAVVNALRQILFVFDTRPNALTLFCDNRGSARVLTERQLAHRGDFGIAEHREGHTSVVVACLGVFENLRHKLEVRGAEEKRYVAHCSAREQRETFGIDFEDFLPVEIDG